MTLAGVKATHPWLDSRMRVTGYSPLQSESAWTNAHLLLGTAVHNVVQELQVRPPDIEAIVDPNLQNIQSKQSKHRKTGANESDRSQMKNDAPPTYSSALFKPTPKVDMPEVSSQFSELSALSREELDTLLNNELDFQAFCSKLPVLKNLQALSISVIDDNAKAADKALENESKLQALQSEAKMYQAQLSEAVERFKALEKKQNDLCKPPDHRRVTRELTKAKKLAFDKSERLADEWLENDAVDVDTFLQEFLDERKRHHSQGAKLELLESK